VAIFHHAIDVHAPRDAVWRSFADLSAWPRWFPRLTQATALADERLAEGAPFCVGGELELRISAGPLGEKRVRVVVRECERGHRVRWTGTLLGVKVNHVYSFEEKAPGATRVTSHEEIEGFAARLLRGAVFDRIDREAHESLRHLKALIEGASAA
jgi:hypothetical protein